MNLYIYSDESGVFDKEHNEYFIYGGLILLGKDQRDECSRKYRAAEKAIAHRYPSGRELKATAIKNSDKGKLFRSMNNYYKFGVIIKQQDVLDTVYSDKKTKQRFLDYAFKMGLKNALRQLLNAGIISINDIHNLHVFVDEHSTATNGKYELRESLLQEFKFGIHNWNYHTFFPPMFPDLLDVTVEFCNSEKKPLVRASDIIANRLYYNTLSNIDSSQMQNIYLKQLP